MNGDNAKPKQITFCSKNSILYSFKVFNFHTSLNRSKYTWRKYKITDGPLDCHPVSSFRPIVGSDGRASWLSQVSIFDGEVSRLSRVSNFNGEVSRLSWVNNFDGEVSWLRWRSQLAGWRQCVEGQLDLHSLLEDLPTQSAYRIQWQQ